MKKLTLGLEQKTTILDSFLNIMELMQKETPRWGPCVHGPTEKHLQRGEFDWYASDAIFFALQWKEKRSEQLFIKLLHDPEDCTNANRREKNGNILVIRL